MEHSKHNWIETIYLRWTMATYLPQFPVTLLWASCHKKNNFVSLSLSLPPLSLLQLVMMKALFQNNMEQSCTIWFWTLPPASSTTSCQHLLAGALMNRMSSKTPDITRPLVGSLGLNDLRRSSLQDQVNLKHPPASVADQLHQFRKNVQNQHQSTKLIMSHLKPRIFTATWTSSTSLDVATCLTVLRAKKIRVPMEETACWGSLQRQLILWVSGWEHDPTFIIC